MPNQEGTHAAGRESPLPMAFQAFWTDLLEGSSGRMLRKDLLEECSGTTFWKGFVLRHSWSMLPNMSSHLPPRVVRCTMKASCSS